MGSPLKGVYPQSDGSLTMAFDEYISMHQNCLSICWYTFSLQWSLFIETKWLSTEIAILEFQLNSNMFNIFSFDGHVILSNLVEMHGGNTYFR